MLEKIIRRSFYLLFFLTPFIFTPLNYELFEYNKMIFVYLMTILIAGLWVIRMIREKKFIFRRTPLDIPLLIFLGSQVLSTIFSIDPHTSVWGYYSRSNGGLLSIISYLLLYWALVSNLSKKEGNLPQVERYLKSALAGGFIIAVWGILEHFGHSISCLLLTGAFNDSCWVQDVQARVFASLGQPNWMAAYIGMLIFPVLYFLLKAKDTRGKVIYSVTLLSFFLAFTYTNSRGATIGAVISLTLFVVIYLRSKGLIHFWKSGVSRLLIGLDILFLVISLTLGTALTSRFMSLTQVSAPKPVSPSSVSQLENGGTESGQIRLIVWKGALDIFKHYPIFGSGVETFAYSYYNFRPAEHNLVSEWDFLYNKAHNEYLNYLATTGLVGLGAYLLLIFSFIGWSIKSILSYKDTKTPVSQYHNILTLSILSSYSLYLIQDAVQFSVVVIALFFYIFSALAFASLDDKSLIFFPFPKLEIPKIKTHPFGIVYKFPKLSTFVISVLMIIFSFTLLKYWLADYHYSRGSTYLDSGNAGRGYNEMEDAVALNSREPIYINELGFAAASASVALQDQDATLSAHLKNLALADTDKSLKMSPRNVSLWRTAIRTYFELSILDPTFNQKTLETMDKTIALAPTDPKLYYNKALVLGQIQKNTEAVDALKKAIELKPNYRDAHFALGTFYQTLGQKDQAIAEYNIVLKLIPNDPEALDKLKNLK